jgi:hypothetical protein
MVSCNFRRSGVGGSCQEWSYIFTVPIRLSSKSLVWSWMSSLRKLRVHVGKAASRTGTKASCHLAVAVHTQNGSDYPVNFSGAWHDSCSTKPKLNHYIMPGKHTEGATNELCDRCKENISVLVVRGKPLCQSVRPPAIWEESWY